MRTRPPRATRRVPDLPGEADRSRQEAVQRVHRLARLDEGVEELRARDLVVAEASTRDEVLSPQVLDQRMIRVVAGRRSLERIALDGDPAPDDLLPRIRFIDDPIADLLQYRRVGMPDAGVGHRLPRRHVEIVARRHLLRPGCLRVPEVDPDLRFVRALVRRESDVAVDAGKGSAELLLDRDDEGAELLQALSGIADELQTRLLHGLLVSFLDIREPYFVVVLRQFAEVRAELRGEVFRFLGHCLGPPLPRHRISPVEHWRERPGIEDRANRGDLLAADMIPL